MKKALVSLLIVIAPAIVIGLWKLWQILIVCVTGMEEKSAGIFSGWLLMMTAAFVATYLFETN